MQLYVPSQSVKFFAPRRFFGVFLYNISLRRIVAIPKNLRMATILKHNHEDLYLFIALSLCNK